MTQKTRLAILVSHPIQHFVHLYRALALRPEIILTVIFCSRIGVDRYFDKEMNTNIEWKTDLLSGYDHLFLPEASTITLVSELTINNPSITRVLRDLQPNAVMLYGYNHLTALRAFLWCKMHGVNVLMTGDGDAVSTRSPLKATIRNLVLRRLLSWVSAFLTVGDQNECMLASLGVARHLMFRTPLPIDEASYLASRNKRAEISRALRAELAIPETRFVFLFVGKLSAGKRPLDLVDAWDALRQAGGPADKVHLLFCGEGVQRAALTARIAETRANATLAGFVNVDQLPRFYCAADVLVHPSQLDHHPLVCSEAAAIGLPLLLSDRVGLIGPTDIGRQGENAFVYPAGCVPDLADAMGRLALSPKVCETMAEASLRVYGECDLQAAVGGVMDAISSVAHNRVARVKR
ncbi:Glycosyl transferases group 1 [Rhizobiales bacterium GAS188]|nr:Glycosyl transferases group 1 [Rhizobiales bacterium GAS188]